MPPNRTTVRLGADERRKQLLSSALLTFGSNGFNGTSMNEVALAAGITKPVLYQHFDSKHDLYLELLRDTGSQLIENIQTAIERADGPRQQVENAFSAYFHFFADDPNNFTVIYGEGVRSDPSFTAELIRVEDSFVAFTADLIDIEGLDHTDRVLIARAMGGLLEAAVRRSIQEEEQRTADDLASLMSELVWRGLRGVGTEHVATVSEGRADTDAG